MYQTQTTGISSNIQGKSVAGLAKTQQQAAARLYASQTNINASLRNSEVRESNAPSASGSSIGNSASGPVAPKVSATKSPGKSFVGKSMTSTSKK